LSDHHHHDHGENCTCGCHDHEHHHHEHGEDCTCRDGHVSVSSHDGSIIGALSGVIAADDLNCAETMLADALRSLAAAVSDLGGIVGHIKFAVTELGRGLQLSVTDEEVTVRRLSSAAYRAEGVAIVFNMAEETLKSAMSDTVGRIITGSNR